MLPIIQDTLEEVRGAWRFRWYAVLAAWIVGVLGWNDAPVVRGRGSAIFLHLARPDLAPTEGCIALLLPDLRAALATGLTAIEVA